MSDEIKKALEAELNTFKTLIESRDKELKDLGAANEATAKALDEAGARIAEMKADLDAQRKRADDAELKRNTFGFPVPGGFERQKSLGESFIESAQYKAMVAAGDIKCNPVSIERKTADPADISMIGSGATSGGAFVQNYRDPRLAIMPNLTFGMRSLLEVVPSGPTNAIEFVRESGFYNLLALNSATVTISDTVLNLKSASGFFAGQTVQWHPETGSAETHIVDAVDVAAGTVTLDGDGVAAGAATGKGKLTGITFVGTGEGKLKPQMLVSYELLTRALIPLAHWIPASRQILSDAPQLRAAIDGRLTYGLDLSEEWECINGSGANQSLEGILAAPGVQTYLWSSGTEGDTRIDALRRAMTLALKLNLGCDGIMINNTDWEHIQLAKGTDGHYLWLNIGSGTEMRMFLVPVIPSEQIAAGTALLGAFRFGATLYDRELTSIRVGEQHADFMIRNTVAILAERRVGLAVKNPQSFVKVTFDAAPSGY
jgi:hypothetical protein